MGSLDINNTPAQGLASQATTLQIYVIGTAHVSKSSSDEVREMIQLVKPEMIMLELCATRFRNLTMEQESPAILKVGFVRSVALNS